MSTSIGEYMYVYHITKDEIQNKFPFEEEWAQ